MEHFFPRVQVKTKKKTKTKRSSPKMEHFFPRIQVKTKKKKVFTKNGTLFSPNSTGDLRSDAHLSQIIGGDADVDHTQIIGGDTNKLLGGCIPPRFRHPCVLKTMFLLNYQLLHL